MRKDIRFLNELKALFDIIKRWFKYRSLRKTVKFKHIELEGALCRYPDEVRIAIEIVKLQAKKNASEVLYAPVSGEFYITNEDKFIILKNQSINIINGLYNYYIAIPYETQEYLDKYLKRIVERKRSKIKRQIESNITRSLNDILEHVKEK